MRMYVSPGEEVSFAKTVQARDLDLFSEMSGDFDPIHTDEAYARTTPFGRRIAHGALVMGVLSTTASMISRKALERGSRGVSVSLGYDKLRFLQPVFIGDTITARYRILEVDAEKGRSRSRVEVENQHGALCLAGVHVMRWLPPSEAGAPQHTSQRGTPNLRHAEEHRVSDASRSTHDAGPSGGACFETRPATAPQHDAVGVSERGKPCP